MRWFYKTIESQLHPPSFGSCLAWGKAPSRVIVKYSSEKHLNRMCMKCCSFKMPNGASQHILPEPTSTDSCTSSIISNSGPSQVSTCHANILPDIWRRHWCIDLCSPKPTEGSWIRCTAFVTFISHSKRSEWSNISLHLPPQYRNFLIRTAV